jgi:hypothetical protein
MFGVHRNTVREWVKRGLPTIDQKRPMLILGRDLIEFLQQRRLRNKRTCQPLLGPIARRVHPGALYPSQRTHCRNRR